MSSDVAASPRTTVSRLVATALSDAAERVPPLWAVRVCVQRGVKASVPDDRPQALAGPRNVRPRVRTAAPPHDRDAAVAIADERGVAVRERLVHEAVVGRTVVDVR